MNIGPSHYLSVINSVSQVKRTIAVQQLSIEPKSSLRDTVLKYVQEIQAALNNTGEDNPRVQELIEKFKGGKKLTSIEMDYIVREAPGMVDYINNITREREMIEQSMKIAGSKFDVGLVVSQASKTIAKSSSNEDIEVRMKHLLDAYTEYQKTDEYKEKPELPHPSMPTIVLSFNQKHMLDAYDKREQKSLHQLQI